MVSNPGVSVRPAMVFWCEDVDVLLTLTATAGNIALPSVTVADLPAGATIARVVALLKYRELEDNSGVANSLVLAGTEHIQVDKSGGSYVDAIKLAAGMMRVGASAIGGGDVLTGDLNISAEVDGEDTYEFRWEGADVTGNNLLVRDVYTGLRVSFA